MGDVVEAAKLMFQPPFRPDMEKAVVSSSTSYDSTIYKDDHEWGNYVKDYVLYR